MSRTGLKKIEVPKGVEVSQKANVIEVKGPKGVLTSPIFEKISMEREGDSIQIKRSSDNKEVRAKHGLTRALLANNILGVTNGFTKNLEILGVGYRAAVKGSDLSMNLGYSHEVLFPIPKDIKIEVKDNTKVSVSGIDKQRVGEIAAQIRSLRPPEPYKGKGVRYADEYVRRKAGKTGKK